MNSLQRFQQEILKLPDTSNERSFYGPFQNFLKDQFEALDRHADIHTVAEESAQGSIGFPDITIRNKGKMLGWIEVKLPEDDLKSKKFDKQFSKYKDSLENIIFTNFRQWELWQWDSSGKAQKVEEITFDVRDHAIGAEKSLEKLLFKFFEGQAYDARTPKQLALALAKKTKLLSQQVEENFDDNETDTDLYKLKKTFSETLIQDISDHQFANMVAETLAYSLFLASLEYTEKHPEQKFTLTTAIDFLPKNVPILHDLYSLVKKVSKDIPSVHRATESLVDQLESADLERIRAKLVEHKPGEDPVIQFYEPFLNEYDPKEREARGVYYTPKPVVDFIVRSVDHLLETKFGKKDGFADEDVNILDPATGTGTFLMSAIQQVYFRTKKKYEALGEDLVRKNFNDIVLKHILKHFYGFELMVAPYAIAHLKLTLETERLGFDFAETYADDDPYNDRFQVFLANTLDNPDSPPKDLFGFDSISKESEKARHVKKNKPILAILGNPPYSNFGMMNKQPWILKLLDDYKKNLGEKKINLEDDYIKFIRFAQWKINQTGQGVFAMITANSFLDGITHRRMRESILETFDEIYIYNLHGNSRKGETCSDGSKDENVFNIQTGVSINIFVKIAEDSEHCKVYSADAWGRKCEKYEMMDQEFEKVKWEEVDYRGFNQTFLSTKWSEFLGKLNFFVPSADDVSEKIVEYGDGWGVQEIFGEYNSGIQTKRDGLTIQFEDEKLDEIIKDFEKLETESIRRKYELVADGRDWTIDFAKKDLRENEKKYVDIEYRPFDIRRTIFTGKSKGFVAYPRTQTMKHMLEPNLGMVGTRILPDDNFQHIFCVNSLIDIHVVSDQNYLFPLYLYPETNQESLLGETERTPNLNPEFLKEFSAKLGFTPSPEEIFYYAYAVFHCPTYRTRYAEQLKIDFPRLPLTEDKELFKKLVQKGNELVNLHLLGENPFDDSATIFDDNSKWHVSVGGTKPENTEDWKVEMVEYIPADKRVYVNKGQYFEGIEKETWEFMIGGYQVLDKWLKDRKKAERCLSADDLMHYMKIVVSLRETQRVMKEIDELIPNWPMK
jgi:predicted helicase